MTDRGIIDVIGLFVFISSVIFSADVAAIIGPYVAIVVAAAIGASFSLARRDQSSRVNALLFFLRVCGLAVLVAGAAAAFLSRVHPVLTERALLAPVAFAIGLIGEDWSDLRRWALEYARDLFFRKRGGDR